MARILLIEPDRPLAETYKQALEDAGHEVVPVSGAQAAIIAADRMEFAAVIVELQLVSHSGFEFLYEFRSYPEWHGIPVLVNTYVPPSAFATSNKVFAEQLGVTTYLYKPQTTLAQLCMAVEQALKPVAA